MPNELFVEIFSKVLSADWTLNDIHSGGIKHGLPPTSSRFPITPTSVSHRLNPNLRLRYYYLFPGEPLHVVNDDMTRCGPGCQCTQVSHVSSTKRRRQTFMVLKGNTVDVVEKDEPLFYIASTGVNTYTGLLQTINHRP